MKRQIGVTDTSTLEAQGWELFGIFEGGEYEYSGEYQSITRLRSDW